MKKLIWLLISGLLLNGVYSAHAQDSSSVGEELKKAGKTTGKAVKKAANTVGNKTAEVGAKGAAKITDRSLKNKKGPNGETVYVDKYERKYYVNKKGKRIYFK